MVKKRRGALKKYKFFDVEAIDYVILDIIRNNKGLGTIELAKEIGLAPKNLINRMKKYIVFGFITKKTIPAKPRGRKRVFELTKYGCELSDLFWEFHKKRLKIHKKATKTKINPKA